MTTRRSSRITTFPLSRIPCWPEYYRKNRLQSKYKGIPENLYTARAALNKKIAHWTGDVFRLQVDAVVVDANALRSNGGQSPRVIEADVPKEWDSRGLEMAYEAPLRRAFRMGFRTVAFPFLGSSSKHYAKHNAAHRGLWAVRKFLDKNPNAVDRIIFCTSSDEEKQLFDDLLQRYFPVTKNREKLPRELYEAVRKLRSSSSTALSSRKVELPMKKRCRLSRSKRG